jgi:hypothetical protein
MAGKILIAFDIEKTGAYNKKHKILSYGIVVGNEEGKILEKFHVNLNVKWPDAYASVDPTADNKILDYGDFEPRCWDEFWSKKIKPSVIEDLKKNAIDQKEGFTQLASWLDEIEKKYAGQKIKFLSDNPSYDIAALDIMLEEYCGRAPIRYDSTGKYRGLSDPWDMLDLVGNKRKYYMDKVNELIGSPNSHDHNPANDAEEIYRMYLAAKLAEKDIAQLLTVC